MPSLDADAKRDALSRISYRAYVQRFWGLDDLAADAFQGRSLDFYAIGIDGITAFDAMETGYPGFAGMRLASDPRALAEMEEPYIHHFPDGNASIARLLVRSLIPAVAPGSTMEDIVTARFDYATLDRPGESVRLRLRSTAVHVANDDDRVRVAYVRDRELTGVRGRHAILAGYHMMAGRIMPELPQRPAARAPEQRQSAAVLHEGRGAPLAAVGRVRGARDHEPDGVLLATEARLPGQHRRLPVPELAGRADGAPPRARPDRAEPGSAAPGGEPAGPAAPVRHDVRGLRVPRARRAGEDARVRRIRSRRRHRRDHGEPVGTRLLLRGGSVARGRRGRPPTHTSSRGCVAATSRSRAPTRRGCRSRPKPSHKHTARCAISPRGSSPERRLLGRLRLGASRRATEPRRERAARPGGAVDQRVHLLRDRLAFSLRPVRLFGTAPHTDPPDPGRPPRATA